MAPPGAEDPLRAMLAQKLAASARLEAALRVRDSPDLWVPDKPRFLANWAAESIGRSLKAIKNHSSELPVLLPGFWRLIAELAPGLAGGAALHPGLADSMVAALGQSAAEATLAEGVCRAVCPLLSGGLCRPKLEQLARLIGAIGPHQRAGMAQAGQALTVAVGALRTAAKEHAVPKQVFSVLCAGSTLAELLRSSAEPELMDQVHLLLSEALFGEAHRAEFRSWLLAPDPAKAVGYTSQLRRAIVSSLEEGSAAAAVLAWLPTAATELFRLNPDAEPSAHPAKRHKSSPKLSARAAFFQFLWGAVLLAPASMQLEHCTRLLQQLSQRQEVYGGAGDDALMQEFLSPRVAWLITQLEKNPAAAVAATVGFGATRQRDWSQVIESLANLDIRMLESQLPALLSLAWPQLGQEPVQRSMGVLVKVYAAARRLDHLLQLVMRSAGTAGALLAASEQWQLALRSGFRTLPPRQVKPLWESLLAQSQGPLRSLALAQMAQNVAVTAVNAAEMRELALLTAAAVAEIKPNGGFELVSAVHSGCLHAVLAADNLGTHEAGENELKTLFAPLWWDEIPQGTDASVLGRGFMSCWQAAKILDDKDLQSRAAKQLLWAVTNAEVNFVGVWMLSELASLCERWQDFEVATVLGHVVRAHQFDEASRDGLLYCSDFYEVRQFGQLLLPVLWRFVELCLQGHSFPDSFAGKLTDITSPVKEMRAAVPTKEADRISMIISVLQIASGLPADFVPPGMVSSSVSLAVGLESAVPKAWRAKLLLATRAAVASGCGRSATAEALQGEMEVLWPWLLQLCSEASSESKGEVQHCSATIMGSVVFAVATSELNSTESKPEHALHSLLTACLLPAAVSRATPGVLAMVAAALQAIHRALSQTSSSTLPPQWLEYLEQLEGAAMKHVHKAKTSALLPVIGELLVLHTERASTKRDDEQAQASPLLRQLGLAVSAAMRQCVAAPEDPAPITFVTKLAEALPQLRPKPSRTDFRVILCAVLHSLGKLVAKGQKDPPLFAALSAIAAGVDDECCSELMTALSSEMASAIPIRNLVALNVTKNLMDTLAARRLTLLFSSNNFRVLPQLAELLTQRHNGPLDAELAATSLKLLHELVTRERVFRLTARHISVIMSVVSHCLADSFPITGEAAKAECGSAAVAKYELLVAILLAMVNHRAAVSRSCQPSSSGCLRWMLVALAEHCLPSSSARQLSRLLEATSSDPQASFKKHAAYFISDYIQVFHGFSVGEELLRELRPGVFAMLAACEDEERKLIHNSAPPVGKTYFKQLVADYNDYYKYKGGS